MAAQVGVNFESGRKIQRAIMRIAEIAAVIQVAIFTVVGALAGGGYFAFVLGMAGMNVQSSFALGVIIGGALGFLFASIFMAFVFTISEIERNTRHVAAMFDRVANRDR